MLKTFSAIGAMLALSAGVAYAQVTDFHLSRRAPTGSLSLVGDAAEDVDHWLVRLTTATGQASAAWYPSKVNVASGFRFDVTVQIAEDPDAGFGLGDGFAVVLQNAGASELGGGGGDLGYGGAGMAGVAIEIDTFGFGDEFATPHLSVQASGSGLTAADGESLGHVVLDPSFINGKPHLMRVVYDAGARMLDVTLDPAGPDATPTLSVPLNLEDVNGTSLVDENGAMYIGMTGATGGAGELVDVDQMRFSAAGCEGIGLDEFDIFSDWSEGDRADFRFDGGGTASVRYQWKLKGTVLSDGGRFGGTRTNKLVIDPILPEDAGQLDFDASNECGGVGTGFTVVVSVACKADFNGDGFLTFEDFDEFVSAFEGGETRADFDGDGFLTFEDFDAFVGAFESGC